MPNLYLTHGDAQTLADALDVFARFSEKMAGVTNEPRDVAYSSRAAAARSLADAIESQRASWAPDSWAEDHSEATNASGYGLGL